MDDLLKKIIYTGIGFAAEAYRKLDDLIDELEKEGKISQEEGEDLLSRFKKETEKSKEELENDLKELLEKLLHKMDIPTKGDVEALEKRVASLEQKLKKEHTD